MLKESKIEWTNYTINPVKGLCPMACPYCYARRMYKRFKWNPEIRYEIDWHLGLCSIKRPSRIFIGSTMELFGDWVKKEWLSNIISKCASWNQHTFIFLTKKPDNLIKWSPFPDNCWVGVSWTGDDESRPLRGLVEAKASVKFISFEPLLQFPDWWTVDLLQQSFQKAGVSWVIIGQQTPVKVSTEPKIGWIQDILVAAHNGGNIPIFIKNNLRSLLGREWPGWKILQEFPKVKVNLSRLGVESNAIDKGVRNENNS